VAAGADGIIVEVHPTPEEALCDAPQLLPTAQFAEFADDITRLVGFMGKTLG
jgi:3-deoxy-7-phosphoheptulonate synthase